MEVGVEMGVSVPAPPHQAHSPWTTAKVPDGPKEGTAEIMKKSQRASEWTPRTALWGGAGKEQV